MKKKILVAGAAGFIGQNLIQRLAGVSKLEIIGVVNRRHQIVNSSNVQYITADLQDFNDCRRVVRGVEQVFMLAGRISTIASMSDNPIGPVRENSVIHVNMLDACSMAGVKKYLWLNSTTGYPDMNDEISEEDYFSGRPPYSYEPIGWMSRYIENLSELYATRPDNPMTVISLRPTAVYGKYDDFNYETCHALPALMRKVIEKQEPIKIWGSGEDRKDWLYVDDLIDACLLAMDKINGYEALNIGSGYSYSLNKLLEIIMELEDCKSPVMHDIQNHKSQPLIRKFSVEKAESLLGYRAKTSIRGGIQSTIEWYKTSVSRSGSCKVANS